MTDWSSLLDTFEERVAHCRRLLDTEPTAESATIELGPWPPPDAPSEPLPAELETRARQALSAAEDLQVALEERRRSLPPPRRGATNRRASGFSTVSKHL